MHETGDKETGNAAGEPWPYRGLESLEPESLIEAELGAEWMAAFCRETVHGCGEAGREAGEGPGDWWSEICP